MFSKIVIARFLYLSKLIDKMYIIILDECEIIHSNIMRTMLNNQVHQGILKNYIHKICKKRHLNITVIITSYINILCI